MTGVELITIAIAMEGGETCDLIDKEGNYRVFGIYIRSWTLGWTRVERAGSVGFRVRKMKQVERASGARVGLGRLIPRARFSFKDSLRRDHHEKVKIDVGAAQR